MALKAGWWPTSCHPTRRDAIDFRRPQPQEFAKSARNGSISGARRRLLDDRIGEFADPGDRDPNHVAGLQEPLRIETDTYPGRSARRDQVAGVERNAGADRLDDRADVEDEVVEMGEMAPLAVDIGGKLLPVG